MSDVHCLIIKYMPLANKIAYKRKKSLPNFIDIEDLRSAAYLGLTEAANRFDSSKGFSFSTFAYIRIFGAIQDYLRQQDYLKVKSDTEDGILDLFSSKDHFNEKEFLDHFCFNLDNNAKKIIYYYFVEGYSMKEIGKKMRCSESRISQLLSVYKSKIKNKIQKNAA